MNRRSSPYQIYEVLYARFRPQHWWPAQTPFEVIVGAILTQNTAWTNVEKAIANLKSKRLLTVAAMTDAKTSALAKAIRPAGYFNIKADRLKCFMRHLDTRYQRRLGQLFKKDTQTLRRELLSIKGIGPETADSITLYAANKPTFVVDAYTKRIFSRVGFFKEDLDYHMVQDYFTQRLPRSVKIFNEYHALIVRLAKEHCRKKPLCAGCPLSRICAKRI